MEQEQLSLKAANEIDKEFDKVIRLAIRWLKEAAKKGSVEAMIHLSLLYAYKNDEKQSNYYLENAEKRCCEIAVSIMEELEKVIEFDDITVNSTSATLKRIIKTRIKKGVN